MPLQNHPKKHSQNPFMPKIYSAIAVVAASLGLAACGDSDKDSFDFYRSTQSLATDKITMVVEANVHTHQGTGDSADETHTTVQVELYGLDYKGYYYNLGLANSDQLSAGIAGTNVALTADYYPNADDPFSVLYYHDFDTIATGTVFDVIFDRERDAALHTLSLSLPPLATFEVSPAAASINLNTSQTLSWTQVEGYSYALVFEVTCEDANQKQYRSRIRLPNSSVATIASPFTYSPANFFSPNNPGAYSNCTWRSDLKTYFEQSPENPAPFAEVSLRSSRQQSIEQALSLSTPE